MRDPDTMVLAIRRPWPHPSPMATQEAERTGRRWRIGCAFWTIAGRGYYWPHLIVIWHRDPSGYDAVSCRALGITPKQDRPRWILCASYG